MEASTELITQCQSLTKIISAAHYSDVAEKRGLIKEMIRSHQERYKPRIDEANQVVKNLRSDLDALTFPLDALYRHLGQLLVNFDTEQEAIRRRREIEAEAAAKAKAEKEALELAELAEQAGLKDLAEEALNHPPEVETVVVVKETPKVEGLSYSVIWDYEVKDFKKLVEAVAKGSVPLMVLAPNAGFLRKQVNAFKDQLNYPGVVVTSRKIPRQR